MATFVDKNQSISLLTYNYILRNSERGVKRGLVFAYLLVLILFQMTPASAASNASTVSEQLGDGHLVLASSVSYSKEELATIEYKETYHSTDPYVLSFPGSDYAPDFTNKIDGNLTESLGTEGYAYGFIMIDGLITNEKVSQIAATGVKVLGYQTFHSVKARIPESAISALRDLSFVRWVGVSRIDQKSSGMLTKLIQEKNTKSIFAYINLYDDRANLADPKRQDIEAFLKSNSVKVIAYYPGNTYLVQASPLMLGMIQSDDRIAVIEGAGATASSHDQSGPSINADDTRGGMFGTGAYNGSGISVGIIDDIWTAHTDLVNYTAGNCTTGCADNANSDNGHGTFVACNLLGRGLSNSKYIGTAPGITSIYFGQDGFLTGGDPGRMNTLLGWMKDVSPLPNIVTTSRSGLPDSLNQNCTGVDTTSQLADNLSYNFNETFISTAGNFGPTSASVNTTPGCSKNSITVGNVYKAGNNTVDTIAPDSSRGPTSDGRFKPDVVAPGVNITSCSASSTTGYRTDSGTSFSTPQVAGVAATLMQHYSWLQGHPGWVKALLTATAIPLNSVLMVLTTQEGKDLFNKYGSGKVDSTTANWIALGSNGWNWTIVGSFPGTPSNGSWDYYNLSLPNGAKRLVVTLDWLEPPAQSTNSRAGYNNVELLIDRTNNLSTCYSAGMGDWYSNNSYDTKQYVAVSNVAAGNYTVKACFWDYNVLNPPRDLAFGVMAIQGDIKPAVTITETTNVTVVARNQSFSISSTVVPSGYISAADFTDLVLPAGVTVDQMNTVRRDGVNMVYGPGNTSINLGDTVQNRTLNWTLSSTTIGAKTIITYVNPSNGVVTATNVTVVVVNRAPNITVTQPASAVVASGNYSVQWNASDDDNDPLNISCYADTGNTGFNKDNTCFTNATNSGSGNCDVTNWATGSYYIWCSADDSFNLTKNYSTGQLIINPLNLSQGWNFISFSTLPSNTGVSSVLSPISGQYSKIQTYNASQGKWLTYDTSVSSGFQTLTNLSIGEGYWLLATQNATLVISSGTQQSSVIIPIVQGWNMFGWPYSPRNVSSALSSISGAYQKIQTYNSSVGWLTYDTSVSQSFDTLANLTPGAAYWLLANQNTTLTMNQ